MLCLVAQAEFGVPAAAELKTELSFPPQNMGRGAGSVPAPTKPPEPLPASELQAGPVSGKRQSARPADGSGGGGGPLLQQSSRQAGLKAVGFLCLNWALLVWEEWGATRGAPDFVRGINFILGVGPQPATRLCKAISAIPLTLTLPANPRGSSFSLTPKESGEGLAADLFSRRSPLHSL